MKIRTTVTKLQLKEVNERQKEKRIKRVKKQKERFHYDTCQKGLVKKIKLDNVGSLINQEKPTRKASIIPEKRCPLSNQKHLTTF